ncbi:MAG TPA: pseudouridine synthase [Phycisphaerales bacterium]|nr:pseudouridine synthase [Phycisphaerales bacterium]
MSRAPRPGGRGPGPRRGAPGRSTQSRGADAHRRPTFLPGGVGLVYEDEHVLVVDKPAGIVTAFVGTAPRGTATSVFDILKKYAAPHRPPPRGRDQGERARRGVFIVHRLDKEATGLLVFARTRTALEALKRELAARRTRRVYLALVHGIAGPPGHEQTIRSVLAPGPTGVMRSVPEGSAPAGGARPPAPGGGPAVTHVRVLAAARGFSLLDVRLETGRKNQIRVHLAELAHPIAGDRRHGAADDPIGRLGLHATELGFTHPATGRPMVFTSPAPESFYRAVGLERPSGPPPDLLIEAEQAPAGPLPAAAAPARASARAERAPSPGRPPPAPGRDTSWEAVADWYDQMLGGDAAARPNDHYQNVILPGTLRLVGPRSGLRVLDIACGQGLLGRLLASAGCQVVGVDAARGLVEAARARAGPREDYRVGDARQLDRLGDAGSFDAAVCVMALTNIDPLAPVLHGAAGRLAPGGVFVAVISHPAFRGPGQTSWGWDDAQQTQYRRVDRYLTPAVAPIAMHPGSDPRVVTWTFHRPIQDYARALATAGLLLDALEEWPGTRVSTSGPRARAENRARREIPLFLALRARRGG